jgi:hypothetical protein
MRLWRVQCKFRFSGSWQAQVRQISWMRLPVASVCCTCGRTWEIRTWEINDIQIQQEFPVLALQAGEQSAQVS